MILWHSFKGFSGDIVKFVHITLQSIVDIIIIIVFYPSSLCENHFIVLDLWRNVDLSFVLDHIVFWILFLKLLLEAVAVILLVYLPDISDSEDTSLNFSYLIGSFVSHDKQAVVVLANFFVLFSINNVDIHNFWLLPHDFSLLRIVVIQLSWLCVLDDGLPLAIFFHHFSLVCCELRLLLFYLLHLFWLDIGAFVFELLIISKELIIFVINVLVIIDVKRLFLFESSSYILIEQKLASSPVYHKDVDIGSGSYLIEH